MLMFNITGFFDTIPHSYLLDTLHKFHIPVPMVKWIWLFLLGCRVAICLDRKWDELKDVNVKTGVPQGLCTSPILAAYFTAPLGEAIRQGFTTAMETDPELSHTFNPAHNSLAPLTLYVDGRSIAASANNPQTATKMVEIAFQKAHDWLTTRGLKLDQVKKQTYTLHKIHKRKTCRRQPISHHPHKHPMQA